MDLAITHYFPFIPPLINGWEFGKTLVAVAWMAKPDFHPINAR